MAHASGNIPVPAGGIVFDHESKATVAVTYQGIAAATITSTEEFTVNQIVIQRGEWWLGPIYNDEYGGSMAIRNKGDKNVLQAGVADDGGGMIETRYKLGYRTGQMP